MDKKTALKVADDFSAFLKSATEDGIYEEFCCVKSFLDAVVQVFIEIVEDHQHGSNTDTP